MDYSMIASAFGAGLLSFFSPCIIPLLPVYIGLLSIDADRESVSSARRVINTIAFVLGISVTFLLLGLGAGIVGSFVRSAYLTIACGLIVIVFGLHSSGFLVIPFLDKEKRAYASDIKTKGVSGSFALGLAFSFGWTPCVGPILGAILALASTQGSMGSSVALLLVYSLGMSIPFVIISLASNVLMAKLRSIRKYLPIVKKIGGILIVVMGLWMVFTQVTELVKAEDSAGTIQGSQAMTGYDELSEWKKIPLQDLEGNEVVLDEYLGKPIYIEFWGTWCSVCMNTIDQYQEIALKHNEAGDVQMLAVAVPGHYGELETDEFIEFVDKKGYQFPILLDEKASLCDCFAVGGFPTSIFIDSSGSVVNVRAGAIAEEELESILAGLD